MDYKLLSALFKGIWLIDPAAAEQYAPLVIKMLEGEQVNFGLDSRASEDLKEPVRLATYGFKVGYYTDLERLPHGSVAIVDLNGPITRYGGACTYGIEHKLDIFRRIENSRTIIGAVLDANTPGGESSGTQKAVHFIRNMKKPVVGLVDDGMAASAGYWILSACRECYATNKLSQIGSIGAFTILQDWIGKLEKDGLKTHIITAPQSTEKNKDYLDALKGDYTLVKEHLRVLVEEFVGDVKTSRGDKLNLSAGDPFKGAMFFAEQAQAIGLIDGFASLEECIGRVEQLSKVSNSNQNNSSTMAKNNQEETNTQAKQYPAIAKAAGWENGHESTAEGIHLNHDEAAAVETALATATDQTAQITKLTNDLTAANTKLEASQKEAAEWKAKAEEYGALETNTEQVAADKDPDSEGKTVALDSVTAEAMAIFKEVNG